MLTKNNSKKNISTNNNLNLKENCSTKSTSEISIKITNQITLLEYHRKSESQKLISIYGPNYLKSNELNDNNIIQKNELNFKNLSFIHLKMIDWMIDIFNSYKSEPKTFYTAVNIFNNFLNYTEKIISENEIHLIGTVCIFIASKFEDKIPLRLKQIVEIISKNKFNKHEINNIEKEILKTINFNLIQTCIYDYVKTFLFDLEINNSNFQNFFDNNFFFNYENICEYLCKLTTLSNEFIFINCEIKALCVLALAFDILKSKIKLKKNLENFLKQWVIFVIIQTGKNQKKVQKYYEKLAQLYYDNINGFLGVDALIRTHPLILY